MLYRYVLVVLCLACAINSVRADYIPRPLDVSKLLSECDCVVVARVTKCVVGEIACPRDIFISLKPEHMLKGNVTLDSLTIHSFPETIRDLDFEVPVGMRVLAFFSRTAEATFGFVLPLDPPGAPGLAAQQYVELLLKPDSPEKNAALFDFARTGLRDPGISEIARYTFAKELLRQLQPEHRRDRELEAIVFKAAIRARYASTELCLALEKLESPRLVKACLASTVPWQNEPAPSLADFALRNPAVRTAIIQRFCTEDDPSRQRYWMLQIPANNPSAQFEDLKTVWTQNKSARPIIAETLNAWPFPQCEFIDQLRKIE